MRRVMRRIGGGLIAVLLVVSAFGGPVPRVEAETNRLSQLQHRLQQLIDEYPVPGEYAVAVTDLQSGETIGVNPDRMQLAGCSINLPLLALATLDMQRGRTETGLVDDLIAQTVYSSNPVTAHDLYEIAGGGDVVAGLNATAFLIDRIGMSRTVLDHAPGYSESVGIGSDNWMTARDANRLLEWLWSSNEFAPDWREYLLGRMSGVKPGLNYLMAAVPSGVVSHKNGFLMTSDGTYVDNDIAVVRVRADGREYAYAISFFSQGVASKYDDIPLGQAIAGEAWDFFVDQYSVEPGAQYTRGR